ncbi:MAG: hypothetical protein LBQ45_02040 [Mycoplasmataceae bacterium]|jgi:hypothetical protein|nr:hypothetical protein [Mycoplasmataceae bacterium]
MNKDIFIYSPKESIHQDSFSVILAYYLSAAKNKKTLLINGKVFSGLGTNKDKFINPISKLIITNKVNEDKKIFDYVISSKTGTCDGVVNSHIFYILDLNQEKNFIEDYKLLIKNKNTFTFVLLNYDKSNIGHSKFVSFLNTNYGINSTILEPNDLAYGTYKDLFNGKFYIKKKLIKIFD